jgi:hypothetical protein
MIIKAGVWVPGQGHVGQNALGNEKVAVLQRCWFPLVLSCATGDSDALPGAENMIFVWIPATRKPPMLTCMAVALFKVVCRYVGSEAEITLLPRKQR